MINRFNFALSLSTVAFVLCLSSCKSPVLKDNKAQQLDSQQVEDQENSLTSMKIIELYNQNKQVVKNATLSVNAALVKYEEASGYVVDESLTAPYEIKVACEGYHSLFYRNQSSLPKKLILTDEAVPLDPASYFFDHRGFLIHCKPQQDKIFTLISFTNIKGVKKGVFEADHIIPAVNKFLRPLKLVVTRHFLGEEHMIKRIKTVPITLSRDSIGIGTTEPESTVFERLPSPYLNVFIVKKIDNSDFLPEKDPFIMQLYQQLEVTLVGPYFLENNTYKYFATYISDIEVKIDRGTSIQRMREILTTENLEITNSTELGSHLYIRTKIKPEAGMGTGMNSLKIRLENFPEVQAVKFLPYQPITSTY